MKFIKAGEIADSNIFNKLDERKKSLLEGGMDVINLSIGTPDFQPGKHVMEAVSRAALDPDMYKYSLNETRELLDAVENWYKRRYDVTLADDEIMAVCGSQEGIAHVGFAFAGPNDLILAPDPGYPIFSFGPMMTGARSVCTRCTPRKTGSWILTTFRRTWQSVQRRSSFPIRTTRPPPLPTVSSTKSWSSGRVSTISLFCTTTRIPTLC